MNFYVLLFAEKITKVSGQNIQLFTERSRGHRDKSIDPGDSLKCSENSGLFVFFVTENSMFCRTQCEEESQNVSGVMCILLIL